MFGNGTQFAGDGRLEEMVLGLFEKTEPLRLLRAGGRIALRGLG